jgi:hypothetical protein
MAKQISTAIRGNNIETLVGGISTKTARVEELGADRTLTEADSGTTFFITLAAGLDIILPAIASVDIGTTFAFKYGVSVASTAHTYTAQAGDLLVGQVLAVDLDTADVIDSFAPDVSDDLIITFASAGTQGGKIGTHFSLTAVSPVRWWVEGVLRGDGTIVTPFS